MPSYAVLLRGVNLGPKRKVPMARLRELLSGMGFDDVRTLLQSGNAVLRASATTPAALAEAIEQALEAEFGMRIGVVVRTGPELDAVIAAHPLADVADNGSRMMALFLSADPDPAALAAFDPVELDPDRVRIGDRVVYQWCPDGVLKAPDIATPMARKWGVTVTGRNWNTVTKLAVMLAD
ncbi:DUF1697 domain-containing protein [Pseudonocardia dioxanivorans]|jgi:uncharacterized protein (DUF1697 family)|uniref:DUF1697 domain-containing protein n=1 Tax=Pseudonocardia dioxanivorans (strain ATCC 55486 / DSM 44775 / JCM 13855 / CB1190) TaxID=675635 RepID=F4CVK3_PSEUX|nr:DUF1697 domain-containing protein [Pseudonocardia dioxanivorans]AEA24178.1 protein of unknown function DUF1697 [Pseudonocardia dioxanivorans CB1190]